jgi:5S rRNA maturation endonuclease (ribonuclease M5)
MNLDLREILNEIGYTRLLDNGKEYRTKPLYRESDNFTSLSIKKDTGYFVDFGANISGSFEELVKLTLNLKTIEDAKQTLVSKNFNIEIKPQKPKIEMETNLDKECLKLIVPKHDYWINRGISIETISVFNGGIMLDGKMKNRYVFPIFDAKGDLVGISGRSLDQNPKIKWKHIGKKDYWKYPLHFNHKIIKEKNECILVESIGDMLKLWDSGIKNTMVIFGLELSHSCLNVLLRFSTKKIIIATNNDENSAGNNASLKIKNKLIKFFDEDSIKIKLPTKNDFGVMTTEEIKEWYKNV